MRVLQHNINQCEAAHDLLTQTVREMKIDVAIIADPYIRLNACMGDRHYWQGCHLVLQQPVVRRSAGYQT